VAASATKVGDHIYDIWAGTQSSGGVPKPCITYVMNPGSGSLTGLDIGAVIQDASTRQLTCNNVTPCIAANSYLTNVFAGFEMWSPSTPSSTNLTITVSP